VGRGSSAARQYQVLSRYDRQGCSQNVHNHDQQRNYNGEGVSYGHANDSAYTNSLRKDRSGTSRDSSAWVPFGGEGLVECMLRLSVLSKVLVVIILLCRSSNGWPHFEFE
jgi:hypothetical protein